MQIVVVLGAISITFVATKSIPGDPVAAMIGLTAMNTEELVEAATKSWGLDKPIWDQYFIYMNNLLHGNLGRSIFTGHPVLQDLRIRFPATLELAISSFMIAMAISIPIGTLSATHRNSIIDHLSRVLSTMWIGAPSFWWGLMLLMIFYGQLGVLSSGRLDIQFTAPPFITGMYTIDSLLAGRFDIFLNACKHLILPALSLGLATNAMMMRLTRSSLLEIIESDYIRTARMKGLPERIVIYRHALRNALIPAVTYASVLFSSMLGGSVMIETIFAWNGMGLYAVNVIFANDYPGILGITFFMIIIYTTSNLFVDLLYGLIDPRVRYE